MTINKKFYDTCSLLESVSNKNLFNEHFCISSVTLQELEHIKTDRNKDEETKYKARKLIHLLDENHDKFEVVVFNDNIKKYISEQFSLDTTNNDVKIAGTAKYVDFQGDTTFVTNDLCCKEIARCVLNMKVESVKPSSDNDYTGYIEVSLNENDMAYFYEHLNENVYGLLVNQYIIIKNENGEIVDKFKWDGTEHQAVKYPTIKSNYFECLKPYNGDIYQQLVLNSLSSNQVTMIKGVAGTGKSYLAIRYMMYLLDKHKIDKIVMFANPTPTANSAKIGFLPGSQFDKLLDSSCGNMLTGKLGDRYGIHQLVLENKLSILPMCDIRGFDTSGLNCAVYITEAQNLDISLMKLALQRIGEDSICIIDGDYNAQVDLIQYAGNNNGMRRMSEVFRGQNFYGEVELKNIYRSKIALVAEQM